MENMKSRGRMLVLITGPSGAGKTDVFKAIISMEDLNLEKVITSTTREPREGEKNGVDYFFISREEFEKEISSNEMLEYALVYGEYYGSRKKDVGAIIEKGKNPLFVVDVKGAIEIQSKFSPSVSIFLKAESNEELRKRIVERGDPLDKIEKRMIRAPEEMKMEGKFDHVILNSAGKLDETVSEVAKILRGKIA